MAIENTYLLGKNITLGCGFDLQAKAPLDSRQTVPAFEGLRALIIGDAAYEGMIVYDEGTKKTYQAQKCESYTVEVDGKTKTYDIAFREFGINEAELKDLIASETTAAMEFKGATATLPENPAKGDMWKVTASFEVAGETAKVGDSIVYNGEEWFRIPSGDDIEDTWRPVTGVNNDASLTFAAGNVLDVEVKADGTVTYSHEAIDAPELLAENEQTRTYITAVETDGHGHITGYKTATENVVDTNTEYTFEGQSDEATSVYFTVTSNEENASPETIYLDAYSKNEADAAFKAKGQKLDAVATDANVFVDTVAQDVDGNITITTKAVDFSAVTGRLDALEEDTHTHKFEDQDVADVIAKADENAEAIADLAELIGEIPAGATATDIVGYVQEKTSGIASEGQMTELSNRVDDVEDAIETLNSSDTVTGSVANSIKTAIIGLNLPNTYAAKADGITSDERTKLAGIATGATKVENVGDGKIKITDATGAENVVTVYAHPDKHAIGDVDGLQDALDGKSDDGHKHVAADITDLTTFVTGLVNPGIEAAQKAGDDAQAHSEQVAKDLAAYVDSNDKALAAETKARDDADKAFETRVASLEAKFGEGAGTVEAQIAAAVKVEEDARKEAVQGVADDLAEYEESNDARVKAIEDDYLVEADKKALQDQIDDINDETEGILAQAKKYTDDEVKELSDGQVTTNKNDIAAIKEDIGNVDNLETTNKDITGAINELKVAIGTGGTAAVVTMVKSDDGLTYTLKQGDTSIGTIDIPKDMVVTAGEVVTNPSGQPEGTYIKLTLANVAEPLYINVGTLVDIYKAKANAAQVQIAIDSTTREISATIVAGSVDTTALADNAVTTVKIADKNVTMTKLSDEIAGAVKSVIQKSGSWDNEVGAKALAETKLDASTFNEYQNEHQDDYDNDEIDAAIKVVADDLKAHTDLSGDDKIHHIHSNKAELDLIVAGKVAYWNGIYDAAKGYTDGEIAKVVGTSSDTSVNLTLNGLQKYVGTKIDGVAAGDGIAVDATGSNKNKPVISLDEATKTSLGKADTAVQAIDTAGSKDYLTSGGSTIASINVTDKVKDGIALAETAVQSIRVMNPTSDFVSVSVDKGVVDTGASATNPAIIATASMRLQTAVAKAETALQEIGAGTGLKVSAKADNKQTIDFDDAVTFIFDCGGAEI